jgi:hypothetical protein
MAESPRDGSNVYASGEESNSDVMPQIVKAHVVHPSLRAQGAKCACR